MVSVNMISDYIYTKIHSYTVAICTDGTVIDMFPFFHLVAMSALCHWLGI